MVPGLMLRNGINRKFQMKIQSQLVSCHFFSISNITINGIRVSRLARFRLRSELQRASTVPAPQASKVGPKVTGVLGAQSLVFWSLGRCQVSFILNVSNPSEVGILGSHSITVTTAAGSDATSPWHRNCWRKMRNLLRSRHDV